MPSLSSPSDKPSSSQPPHHFGFLLLDGFALMSAASAIEPLRAANHLSGDTRYRWSYLSEKGGKVAASCGAVFETERLDADKTSCDTLFIISGGDPVTFEAPDLCKTLTRLAQRDVPLGGISGGGVLLAKAGLMTNRRFTVHWEHFDELQALSPAFLMERRLFVIDRDRLTCAGGVAPLDMMHAMIRSQEGAALAQSVMDWFIHTGIRQPEHPQKLETETWRTSINGSRLPPVIEAAVDLMETHLADPLSLKQLAMLCGTSERQLQRRFSETTGRPITQTYMDMRLSKARDLLETTHLPITEVGHAIGFISQSHFASTFRRHFGKTPSEWRKAKLKA